MERQKRCKSSHNVVRPYNETSSHGTTKYNHTMNEMEKYHIRGAIQKVRNAKVWTF